MKMPRQLRGRQGVVLDTMVFIYLFEDSPEYGPVSEFIVDQARRGEFKAAITPITAAEILVKPLERNRQDLADRYRRALKSMKNVEPLQLSFEVGSLAGSLRAKYKLPLPDMFQAACALLGKTPTLITNDKAMQQIKEVQVLPLSAFK